MTVMHDPRLLPFSFARDFGLLAQAADDAVDIWLSDATAPAAVAEVGRRFGRVRLNALSREQLDTAIARAYAGSGGDAAQVVDEFESDLDLARLMQEMPAIEDLLESADDAPVIRMINALLTQALRGVANARRVLEQFLPYFVPSLHAGNVLHVVQCNSATVARLMVVAHGLSRMYVLYKMSDIKYIKHNAHNTNNHNHRWKKTRDETLHP